MEILNKITKLIMISRREISRYDLLKYIVTRFYGLEVFEKYSKKIIQEIKQTLEKEQK